MVTRTTVKRVLKIAILIYLVVLGLAFCSKPLIVWIAKQQIQKIFPGSKISIDNSQIKSFRELFLSEVRVQKPNAYDITAIRVSVGLRPRGFSILGLYANGPDFKVEEASVNAESGSRGELSIKKIQYRKVRLNNINAGTTLQAKGLFLDSLVADAFKGKVQGDINLEMGKAPQYAAQFSFEDLDLSRLVQELEMQERLELSGLLEGTLDVQGSGGKVSILNGNLRTGEAGGVINVKDKRTLGEGVSELVVDSLKNYRYNIANARVYLEGTSVVLDTAMDSGEFGPRKISIYFHN